MATILVVDDRPINRNFLLTLLGYYGHTLFEASDGIDALAQVRKHRPDLVITDILMPNMDGEEFVRQLRADPATKDMPVIFYTATYRAREARTISDRVGVRWVLAKPSDPELIVQTVAEALGAISTVPPALAPAATPTHAADEVGQSFAVQLTAAEALTGRLSTMLEGALAITEEQAASLAGVRSLDAALRDMESLGLRLTGLIEIGQAMASLRPPADLVAMFCRAMQDILIARYAGVVMIDTGQQQSIGQFVALGLEDGVRARVAEEIVRCPAHERVLAAERPVRACGVDASAALPVVHPRVKSFLACPIVALGRTSGWMYVADRLGLEEFTPDDERIALTLASQLALAWDNTQLHEHLEQQVARRTRELEAANQELEAFSYSVSHDLRAPLRAIDGYARMVLEQHAGKLPPEGQRHLGLVREQAEKMATLIDDLLELARVGRRELGLHPVNLRAFVQNCVREVGAGLNERKVEWVIGDLPTVNGDPILLKQMYLNLLSNALKYTGKRKTARIEIGAERRGNEQVVYMRDNGAGFDMAQAGKLFGVFQRLHTQEDYPGTGIGLAIVRRVAERHGARVWAEGAPERGATFYVAFPAQA